MRKLVSTEKTNWETHKHSNSENVEAHLETQNMNRLEKYRLGWKLKKISSSLKWRNEAWRP